MNYRFLLGLLAWLGLSCRDVPPVMPVLPEDLNLKASPGPASVQLAWNPRTNWYDYVDLTGPPRRFVDPERVDLFRSVGDTLHFEKIASLEGRERAFKVPGQANGTLVFFKAVGVLPEPGKTITETVGVVPNRIAAPTEVLRADNFRPGSETYYVQEYRVDPTFRFVALERMLNGSSSIWLHEVSTRSTNPLPWGGSKPTWSPDGKSIASFARTFSGLSTFELTRYDPATKTSQSLGGVPYLTALAWSPNGAWLAYQSSSGGFDRQIGLVSADGARRSALPLTDPDAFLEKFSWFPDGESLLLTLSQGTPSRRARYRLVRTRLDGPAATVVFESPDRLGETTVAPDGTIYFMSNLPGYPSLWSLAPATGRLTQLSDASERFTNLSGLHFNAARQTLLFRVWSSAGWVLVELKP